jgi:ribosomal protein L37AE/L43A
VPRNLRPFFAHGVRISWTPGEQQARGECPLCGRESKFFVAAATGLWDCKVCGAKGNPLTFLRQFWDTCDKATKDYDDLAAERGLMYPETLMAWQVVKNILTGEWMLPGFGGDGKLCNLYRYVPDPKTKKRKLYATPETGHGIHGVNLFDPTKPDVYLLEGPWDAMALWEVMKGGKTGSDGKLTITGNMDVSLLASANILAAPGQSVFNESWVEPLFGGRRIRVMYDSDHPKKHPTTGADLPPSGYDGCRRVVGLMSRAESRPVEVNVLTWGEGGYDPGLKSGYDVRDALTSAGKEHLARLHAMDALFKKVVPCPAEWVTAGSGKGKKGVLELELKDCRDWATLIGAWRKALHWTEGLDRTLSCMLASVLSTKAVGDQLWMKIIGPPSCGKSVLCEAISANMQYILAKSTIRGFHSGFQTDRGGDEDNSLIALVKDKTLITKDGDTLLQSPNIGQILSEARDVYDRVSRTHYRNKMSRDYTGINMTWLLCGTESLRSLDDSELGERFLDCIVIDDMDPTLERAIARKKALQARAESKMEVRESADSMEAPEMVEAKRLTGGYVAYLRENAEDLLGAVGDTPEAIEKCVLLAEFVAFMRARPSSRQEETVQREMSFRLTSQIIRLASCLAVVLNKPTIDDPEVMRRTARCALDTARGRTLELVKHLASIGPNGATSKHLCLLTNQPEAAERDYLQFMRKLKAVELFRPAKVAGIEQPPRWRLTPRLRGLYDALLADPTGDDVIHD